MASFALGLTAGVNAGSKIVQGLREQQEFERRQKEWADEDKADRALNDTTPIGTRKFDPKKVYQGEQGRALQEQDAAFGDIGTSATAQALNSAQGAPQLSPDITQSQTDYMSSLQDNMRSAGVSAKRQFGIIRDAGSAAAAPMQLRSAARADAKEQRSEDLTTLGVNAMTGDPAALRQMLSPAIVDAYNNNPNVPEGQRHKITATGNGVVFTRADGSEDYVPFADMAKKLGPSGLHGLVTKAIDLHRGIQDPQYALQARQVTSGEVTAAAHTTSAAASTVTASAAKQKAETDAAEGPAKIRLLNAQAKYYESNRGQVDKSQSQEYKDGVKEFNKRVDDYTEALNGTDQKAIAKAQKAVDLQRSVLSNILGKPKDMPTRPGDKPTPEWKLSTDGSFRSNGEAVQDFDPKTNSWRTRGLPAVSPDAAKAGVVADVGRDGRPAFKGRDGWYTSEQEAAATFKGAPAGAPGQVAAPKQKYTQAGADAAIAAAGQERAAQGKAKDFVQGLNNQMRSQFDMDAAVLPPKELYAKYASKLDGLNIQQSTKLLNIRDQYNIR